MAGLTREQVRADLFAESIVRRFENSRETSIQVVTRLEDYVPGGLKGFRALNAEDQEWWIDMLISIHAQWVRLHGLWPNARKRALKNLGNGDKRPDHGRDPAEMIAAAIDHAINFTS